MRLGSKLLLVGMFTATSAFAKGLTLKELQSHLSKKGESWKAGETGVAESLGLDEGRENPFGLNEMPSIMDSEVDNSIVAQALPASWDWRNKDGKNYMSPIRNQGRCGSCVAFASVGMFEGNLNIAAKAPGLDLDLSEQAFFNQVGKCDSGAMTPIALAALKSTGLTDEACAPYTSGRLGVDGTASGVCSDRSSRMMKAATTKTLTTRDAIKTALMQGPVMTTMSVYEDFMFYTSGVYKHVTGDYEGGHAIVLVGWNDADQAWIVRNSWGPTWGEQGYFRIKYDDVSGLGLTGYAITVNAPAGIAKLKDPAHLEAIGGPTNIAADTQFVSGTSSITVNLKGKTTSGTDTMQIPMSRANVAWDSSRVADGLYEVSSSAGQGAKFYELVIVANNPQNISLTVSPDFDNSAPVKDVVAFKIHSNESKVPLTSAEIVIRKIDGTASKTSTIEFPGTDSKAGWRTTSYPNGTYEVQVRGNIGSLQQFTSNKLTVKVAN